MKTKKILYLNLKQKWFDMILSGIKKEEYRSIKEYWSKRLIDRKTAIPIPYDVICFRNGYKRNAREIIVEYGGFICGKPNPDWTDEPEYIVFKLSLGKILSTKNI